ncbi:MAG TPA: baseplate J/gp47 family protein [Anaerolineales bacterium]|nr:baseplate J/gp47 family protein [Anaerolineales bacterium]
MKTQIITLESHDDLISVRDRMSWAKTPRILLVWPKYEKVSLRQVDLKVLQRHASALGAQLGLVSRIRRVRLDAEALNIPVFKSTGEAQRVTWPKPRRRRRLVLRAPRKDLREQREQVSASEEPWRTHPALRVSAFLIGVLAVLSLVALFIPRARITLDPVSKTQSLVLPVSASPSVDSVFITGSIPMREKRFIADGTETVTVTSAAVVPQSTAKGIVEFRNLTQQSVTVPADTIVQNADGIRFMTTEEGEVAAGVGETLELPIEAVEGGVAGNSDSETINAIEGRLGLSLSVTNPEPTSGGRELPSVQASDADRERVKTLLMKNLEEQAREKFESELSAGDLLFDKTLTVSQILLEEYNPPAGAAGRTLTLDMQAEYAIQYADASDLTELALLALNASLPADFRAAETSVTVDPVSSPTVYKDGSAKWTMRAERRIVQQIDPAWVSRMVQGFGVWNVESKLKENLPLTGAPEIQLTPSWWPWMPIVPFRISVETQ